MDEKQEVTIRIEGDVEKLAGGTGVPPQNNVVPIPVAVEPICWSCVFVFVGVVVACVGLVGMAYTVAFPKK